MTTGLQDRKVLSIGYGAFTIRLEGFDDPFPYLKRITEYFRVIAHHDRTFGSKPLSAHPEAMQIFSEVMHERGAHISLDNDQMSVTPNNINGVRQVQDFIPAPKSEEIVASSRVVSPDAQEPVPVLEEARALPLTDEFESPLIVRKEVLTAKQELEIDEKPAGNERVLLRPGKAVQGFSMFSGKPKQALQDEASLDEFRKAFRRYQFAGRGAKRERDDNPFSRLKDELQENIIEEARDNREGQLAG